MSWEFLLVRIERSSGSVDFTDPRHEQLEGKKGSDALEILSRENWKKIYSTRTNLYERIRLKRQAEEE